MQYFIKRTKTERKNLSNPKLNFFKITEHEPLDKGTTCLSTNYVCDVFI